MANKLTVIEAKLGLASCIHTSGVGCFVVLAVILQTRCYNLLELNISYSNCEPIQCVLCLWAFGPLIVSY